MALFNSPELRKPGFRLALFGTLLACVVVILGAFTRLVDAGLGCPDWPGCYGHLLWPTDEAQIAAANQAFPDMPVEMSKTWPEMVHRYFAGTLGLVVLALTLIALRYRKVADYPFRMPMFMSLLIIWQALFGMWTVTLKLWPQVVAVHLMGGMTTLTLLWVYCLRLDNSRWKELPRPYRKVRRLRKPVIFGVVLVSIQILLGGWVAANYAAFGCPDFPTCRGEWWPSMNFRTGFNVMQQVGPNYLGGLLDGEARAAIHMVHRIGALIVTLYLIGLGIKSWRTRSSSARRLVKVFLGILLVQLALGIANVLFQFPLSVAVAHNFFGALLLLSLVTLLLRTMTVVRQQPVSPSAQTVQTDAQSEAQSEIQTS